jgi:hypothetical protein
MDLQDILDFKQKIYKICRLTGDSILKEFSLRNGFVIIIIELDDESHMSITFKSSYIYFEGLDNDSIKNTGILQYTSLKETLNIENNYYVLNGSFTELMKLSKSKASLAIGIKSTEADYLIYYKGYSIKFAFLVNSSAAIEFVRLNNYL